MKSFTVRPTVCCEAFYNDKYPLVKRFLLLLTLLVTTCLQLVAQNVSGRVTDSRTGRPIPFANVHYEVSVGVQTDTAGRYTIPRRAATL